MKREVAVEYGLFFTAVISVLMTLTGLSLRYDIGAGGPLPVILICVLVFVLVQSIGSWLVRD